MKSQFLDINAANNVFGPLFAKMYEQVAVMVKVKEISKVLRENIFNPFSHWYTGVPFHQRNGNWLIGHFQSV